MQWRGFGVGVLVRGECRIYGNELAHFLDEDGAVDFALLCRDEELVEFVVLDRSGVVGRRRLGSQVR